MNALHWLLAIGAALVALWAWLLITTPPKECDDECQRECCADNSLDVPEDAR